MSSVKYLVLGVQPKYGHVALQTLELIANANSFLAEQERKIKAKDPNSTQKPKLISAPNAKKKCGEENAHKCYGSIPWYKREKAELEKQKDAFNRKYQVPPHTALDKWPLKEISDPNIAEFCPSGIHHTDVDGHEPKPVLAQELFLDLVFSDEKYTMWRHNGAELYNVIKQDFYPPSLDTMNFWLAQANGYGPEPQPDTLALLEQSSELTLPDGVTKTQFWDFLDKEREVDAQCVSQVGTLTKLQQERSVLRQKLVEADERDAKILQERSVRRQLILEADEKDAEEGKQAMRFLTNLSADRHTRLTNAFPGVFGHVGGDQLVARESTLIPLAIQNGRPQPGNAIVLHQGNEMVVHEGNDAVPFDGNEAGPPANRNVHFEDGEEMSTVTPAVQRETRRGTTPRRPKPEQAAFASEPRKKAAVSRTTRSAAKKSSVKPLPADTTGNPDKENHSNNEEIFEDIDAPPAATPISTPARNPKARTAKTTGTRRNKARQNTGLEIGELDLAVPTLKKKMSKVERQKKRDEVKAQFEADRRIAAERAAAAQAAEAATQEDAATHIDDRDGTRTTPGRRTRRRRAHD